MLAANKRTSVRVKIGKDLESLVYIAELSCNYDVRQGNHININYINTQI